MGDVFKAAVPSGLKIESETQIACNDDFIEDTASLLKEREAVLLDTLRQNAKMSIQELEKASGLRHILPTVRTLMEQNAVVVSEELQTKYRPAPRVTYGSRTSPPARTRNCAPSSTNSKTPRNSCAC